ncbi:homoserine O-acetyltransferase [Wolffia australiana]
MAARWVLPSAAPPVPACFNTSQSSPLSSSSAAFSRGKAAIFFTLSPPSAGREHRHWQTRIIAAGAGPSNSPLLPQDDVDYLWKLAVGSVAGAAAIKYGSALFPEITRPSLPLALFLIGLPVVISILLLIKGSTSKGGE